MPATVVVIPALRRPQNIERVMGSLDRATPEPHRALFVADWNDDPTIEALQDAGADYWLRGPSDLRTYAAKINFGIRWSHEPLIFAAADDVAFQPGWLTAILAILERDPEAMVVGTLDMGNVRTMAGLHSTHTLVRRSYVEQRGTIDGDLQLFHEGYPHDFCDDEMIQTAMARGVYRHSWNSVVEHLHPIWGKGEPDATYRLGASTVPIGRALYEARRPLWEGMTWQQFKTAAAADV